MSYVANKPDENSILILRVIDPRAIIDRPCFTEHAGIKKKKTNRERGYGNKFNAQMGRERQKIHITTNAARMNLRRP